MSKSFCDPFELIFGPLRQPRTTCCEPPSQALPVWIGESDPGNYCMMSLQHSCPVVLRVYSRLQATHSFSIVFLSVATWASYKVHHKALKRHRRGDSAGDFAVVWEVSNRDEMHCWKPFLKSVCFCLHLLTSRKKKRLFVVMTTVPWSLNISFWWGQHIDKSDFLTPITLVQLSYCSSFCQNMVTCWGKARWSPEEMNSQRHVAWFPLRWKQTSPTMAANTLQFTLLYLNEPLLKNKY